MKRLTDILKRDLLRRIICFLVLQFCCLSIMQPYSFAADQNNSAQTSDTNGSGVSEPSYYQDAKVTHTKNRKGEQVEFVSVKNAYKYVKQDTNYLTQITLNNNVTSEDIAYLLQRYPSTLGSFDGTEAVQEERIVDKLDDMKDDGEITEDQYKNARRKISLAFDELYKQSMRQAIAVGEGNVESFDPSKLTSDPAYHRAYNRAVRDEKDGIFTEEETETRKQDYISDGLAKKHVIEKITSPKECDIDGMRKQYQSKCYSCVIIKTLLETFLNACSKAYDITSEAGVKLLVLGALVWMAFFVMKNVSSLSNIEPGAMMNTLTVFLFKVMVAYILITSGLGVLVKYTINPLLTAGADMGIAYTSAVSYKSEAENFEYAVETPQVKAPTITTNGVSTEVVPAEVLNKVMLFAEKIDKNVSTNLVIGHAITCFSMEGGAWTFDIIGKVISFRIVNLWLWFCGALIWFVGFMLTLGIGYYLLDISFKLGFSIMALPVVIGLWPFNVTKGKVTAVIGIMLKAAGTFVFLGLTTSYALAMISTALRDVDTLLDNIKNGNAQWVSETFELTGPYFLIILFAFLYSMKLISSTITDYVDKFFKDGVFGGADPMHKQLTQMTDFAKQQAMRPVKWAGGKASDAVKKQVTEGAAKAGKFVRGLFKGKANGDQEKDDKGGGNPVSGGGTAIKNTGKGAKAAGATMEQSGKGVQAAGKGMEAGGKAAQAGGKGLMSAGKGLSATGLGAIVGVPMMIAGAAAYGAGKGAEVAGKVTQKAGKAMQKGGKAMKKVGEKMEKAGEKMEKMGNKLKFGDEKAPEPENRDNRSSGEESSKPEEQNEPEKPEDNNKPDNGK